MKQNQIMKYTARDRSASSRVIIAQFFSIGGSVCSALMVLAALLFISSCSSNKDKKGVSGEKKTYENAQAYLRSRNWQAAIETLQLLEENYPFGKFAEQGQLELIFAYYKGGEQDLSISAADRFIRLHPQQRHVDYAYYMRGIASFNKDSSISSVMSTDISKRDPGSARESFNYFSQLINRYPNSQYVADAQKRMVYLRNMLARYEIHVANYYLKRGAYLAAANRGRFVVESFQTCPAVPDGLAVMVQAYHLLGMQELSDDASKVLIANFPNYPAIKKGKFDLQFGRDEGRSWVSYLTLGLFDKRGFVEYDTRKLYDPYYSNKSASVFWQDSSGSISLLPPPTNELAKR